MPAARALLAACAILAGCASPPVARPLQPELFAVVPGANGHVGAIVVHRGGDSRVIDRAYGAQRVRADGSVEAATLTPDEVSERFAAALDALPGRPARFMLHSLEGRDELTPESRVELERVLAELRRRPQPDIVVIGHTDTVGGMGYNDRLSLARAQRMREMLLGLGIAADRVQATGRGERELLVPTEDNVPEPRNRRVEINVR